MKIATWNCNGALRNKFHELIKLDADIYIIQECENPEQSKGDYRKWAENYLWHGSNKHKGIGIFGNHSIEFQKLNWQMFMPDNPDRDLQYFLPVRINNKFNLIGVWTKQADSPTFKYIGQVWKYLELHKEKMAQSPSILCGDFNSNKIWDVWDRWWNHSDVVRELQKVNMVSLYHLVAGEEQGNESTPTFYLHRNLEKSYHIDYAFCTDSLFQSETNKVSIGHHNDWLKFSDHMPMIFTIEA